MVLRYLFVWKQNEMLRMENFIGFLLKQWVYFSVFVSVISRKTALQSLKGRSLPAGLQFLLLLIFR